MKIPKAVELPSGSWRVQLRVGGERISITDTSEERAVSRAMATRERVIEKSKEPKTSPMLRDAVRQYIDDRGNVLSPATIRGYENILKFRFQNLMKMRVSEIEERHLQAAINSEASERSRKTIRNGMGLILAALGDYKQINAKRLRYPQQKRKEHTYLEGDQILRLISACQGDTAEIPILLGVWLGLRRSEILGLQWEGVNFLANELHIDHSLVFDKDGNPVLKSTMKTTTSNRVLPCPKYIMDKLGAYQPDPEKRTGTVFDIHPNTIYQNLEKICKRAGIPFVGVHGLRHTNASVMLSLGIVDKIAMSRGGWSSKETMERIYQHIFSADQSEANRAIDAYFEALISDKVSHEMSHENNEAL